MSSRLWFREWDSKRNEFYFFNLQDNVQRDLCGSLTQFTGLYDKNGKTIFEGDILSGYRKGSNSDLNYTGVIEWQTEQAGYIIKCGKYFLEILSLAMSGDGTQTRLNNFEVIGNIFETPYLISTIKTEVK